MSRLRLAILADIHGNLPALEAVCQDLDGQSPDAVHLLGDLVNRCPWNQEVMDLVADREWPSIQGNHDLIVGHINTPEIRPPFTVRERFPLIYWTWEQLTEPYLQTLRALPAQILLEIDGAPPLRLFHGLPENPFQGIVPENDEEDLDGLLTGLSEPYLLCGHTHHPLNKIYRQQRILNPGSVGLPYNGDPRAQYMLLDLESTSEDSVWKPTFRQVDYDHSGIEDAFQRSGMIEASGALARLYLRTVLDGLPWASDYGHWLKDQPPELRTQPARAVEEYLRDHGPSNWAFLKNT